MQSACQISAYAHYARTPVLKLKQKTDDMSEERTLLIFQARAFQQYIVTALNSQAHNQALPVPAFVHQHLSTVVASPETRIMCVMHADVFAVPTLNKKGKGDLRSEFSKMLLPHLRLAWR
jgi:hypothetical protein